MTLSLQLTENDDIVRTNRSTNLWSNVDTKQPTDVQQQAINEEKKALLARCCIGLSSCLVFSFK